MVESREQRRQRVEDSRASLAAEGLVPSPYAQELAELYIDGELTAEQCTEMLLRYHGLPQFEPGKDESV